MIVPLGAKPSVDSDPLVTDLDGDGLLDVAVGTAGPLTAVGFEVTLNALGPWIDIGQAKPASPGTPVLAGSGVPQPGEIQTVQLSGLSVAASGFLFVGLSPLHAPFKGGDLVPSPDLAFPVPSAATLQGYWPGGLPPGAALYLQAWFALPGSEVAASNALVVIAG